MICFTVSDIQWKCGGKSGATGDDICGFFVIWLVWSSDGKVHIWPFLGMQWVTFVRDPGCSKKQPSENEFLGLRGMLTTKKHDMFFGGS